LRTIEYSEDEKGMAQNLINMYYEFSVNDLPKFGMQAIHPSFPDDIQCLEISSNEKYSMKMVSEKFGNLKFWKEIDRILHSNERNIDEL
jgi:hypothetical protein